MSRQALAYAGLAGLAAVWATWPGADLAAGLGVGAFLLAGVAAWRGARLPALLALGAGAATSLGLEAATGSLHAWIAVVPAWVALDGLLALGQEAPPRPALARTGLALGLVAAIGGLLAVWRPTQAMLAGEMGILPATLLLGAFVAAAALWLTAAEPTQEGQGAEAQGPEAG